MTEKKMTAVLEGRELMREFRIAGAATSFFLWHFPVGNDGDYFIVAALIKGSVATKVLRDIDKANEMMDALIAEVAARAVTGEISMDIKDVEKLIND